MKRLNLQVYQKVIIVFAALVIPMTAITIAINMNAVSYLKDKHLESTRDKVNYYRDQLNNQITFIRNQGQLKAIKEGLYGRCVYHCDNNVVDHQVVSMDFHNEVTAVFTMSVSRRNAHGRSS
ncbi:hypothetical protein ABU162_28395 [Paenibacillus thiaminolyticus]|uniref:hypothetical protein n=1 Tax=Paenibacillus thiaminolyticus TaxID=49283 RepID=UPI0035A58F25